MSSSPEVIELGGYCGRRECKRVVDNINEHFDNFHVDRDRSCPFSCGYCTNDFSEIKRHVSSCHGKLIGHDTDCKEIEIDVTSALSRKRMKKKLLGWGQEDAFQCEMRKGFLFKYNEQKRMPDYVFYCVSEYIEETLNGNDLDLTLDEKLDKPQLASTTYKYMNLIPGQLIPHQCFAGFPEIQKESAKLSVAVPMKPKFKRGLFQSFIDHVTELVKCQSVSCVYVWFSPRTEGTYPTIPNLHMTTNFIAAVVLSMKDGTDRLQAFELPHVDYGNNLFAYRTSINFLEKKYNLTILPYLLRHYTWYKGVETRKCYVCRVEIMLERFQTHWVHHVCNNYCLRFGCYQKFRNLQELSAHLATHPTTSGFCCEVWPVMQTNPPSLNAAYGARTLIESTAYAATVQEIQQLSN